VRRLAWSCSLLALVLSPPVSAEIRATTGEPEFLDSFTPTRPMAKMTFEDSQSRGTDDAKRIVIRRLPDGTTDAARFGTLQFETPLLYVVEPGDDGLEVYVDRNRDGDLTNDPAVELTPAKGPFDGAEASVMVVPELRPGTASIKVIFLPDLSMVYLYQTQTRKGTLEIGDRSIEFALQGRLGVYNETYSRIYLDVDGDGEFQQHGLGVEGAYEVSEEHLFLDDQRYSFHVARDGSSLTLTAAPGGEPPPAVWPGKPAAKFSFVDMAGDPGTIDDYKGKTVLLYFWGSWCGPCIHTMPDLAKTYREFHAGGFEVLAIAKQSPADDVRAIMVEHDLDWRHVLEDESNPIASLYRIRGVPNYVLIDAEGTIVERGRGIDLGQELTELLAPQTPAD